MIRRIVILILLCGCAGVANRASAQTRDNIKTPVGTGSISGVVMSDGSPSRPIRRVMVTLGSGGVIKVPMAAITDDNGAFTFTNLPEGTYTLVATRPAYVPTAYGAKAYGRGSGVPISLGAGQQLTGIVLRMLHGGVIAGTIRDPAGAAASGVEIIMMTVQTQSGRRKTTPVLQSGSTDGRGEYRIYGLAPGEYVVRAQPPPRLGVGGDLRPTTPAELEWAKQAAALQSTAAAGAAVDVPAPPPNGRPVTYSPAYYPGTPDASAATSVILGPNEERLGVDFSTALVPVASISGRVVGPDGQAPKSALVSLQLAQTLSMSVIDTMMAMGMGGGVRVGADGRLSGSGITPGHYRLVVRGVPAGPGDQRPAIGDLAAAAGAPGAAMMATIMAGAMGATLWASEDLDIDGRDISGLELRLQPGMTMSGTVVFEGEDPQSPVDATRVVVMLNTALREAKSAFDMLAGMIQGTPGHATKERTFTVAGLTPDTYRSTFLPPGLISPLFGGTVGTGGWVLKSAMLDGRDLADLPIEVRPGEDIKGVVVAFSREVTQISGRVQDAAGRPVSGFPIVVFPTDRALWSPGARRILPAKPASDGSYKVNGLPAGEYYVCAVTDLDPNDLYDAAYLEQLVAGSFKITLGEGEKKVQDLRLGGGSLQ